MGTLRILLRSPGFVAAAALALALGIGANTAIFTVVNSVLLRPLGYAQPDRLVVALTQGRYPVSPADYRDYREAVHAFDQLAAAQMWSANLTGQGKAESIPGMQVTANLLPTLGVPPLLGRTMSPEEEQPGSQAVVVLSHKLWVRRFGGDPSIVGRTALLDAKPFLIIGVMPATFQFAPFWATRTEMWTPLTAINGSRIHDRAGRSLRVFGRLREGVTLAQAQSQMDVVARRLAVQYPATDTKAGLQAMPLQEKVVGAVRPTLIVLLATVALVLMIACANVSNLMLTRAIGRRREIAVRAALGASRGRLVRELLLESLLVALIGGVAGLALAQWGVQLLTGMLPPGSMPRQQEIAFDLPAFVFALGASLLSGLLAGVIPAWRFSDVDLNDNLKDAGRGTSQGAGRKRTHGILVTAEVAIAVTLLAGAGLMIRTMQQLQAVDPGFQPHGLLTFEVSVGGTPFGRPERRAGLFQEVQEQLATVPGVESVGAINHLPIGGDLWGVGYSIVGRPEPPPGEKLGATYRVVRPGYFETMRIALKKGRLISDRDVETGPAVAVINEAMAKRQWPASDPIGQQVIFGSGKQRQMTIVGIVKDTRQSDWTSPIDDEIYIPYAQLSAANGPDYLTFVVRTQSDPKLIAGAVQQRIWAINRDLPVSRVSDMEQVIADHLWRSRLSTMLLGLFAAIAIVLAALGIYGVTAYSVRQRRNEIGIRMALGAKQSQVLGQAMLEGMRPVCAGALVGLILSAIATRWMASLLYGVRPTDPATFGAVIVLLLAVAAVANYFPARRAAGVDPLVALRYQ